MGWGVVVAVGLFFLTWTVLGWWLMARERDHTSLAQRVVALEVEVEELKRRLGIRQDT